MANEKWYENLTGNEIIVKMSRIAHESVAHAKKGDMNTSEKYFDEFKKLFDEVIPAVVEIKTEFYMYNKEVWEEWNKVQRDLWAIRRGMENDIWNAQKD